MNIENHSGWVEKLDLMIKKMNQKEKEKTPSPKNLANETTNNS